MVYKKGNKWKISESAVKYNTKAEAEAALNLRVGADNLFMEATRPTSIKDISL